MFEIGNSLREARIRQGLDFAEVEQATKIRGKYLRALEDEHFEQLPAQTYVKGFLRTYADYLGLEGQLYVDEYNTRYVTGAEDEPPLRVRGGSGAWPRSPRLLSSAVLIALTAIGLSTALVIAAWKFGATEDPGAALPKAGAEAKPRGKPATRPRVRSAPAAAKLAGLVVSAKRGDCWLVVHRGSPIGELEYEGTLLRGQTQRFRGRKLWVSLGAPENVVLKLNGRRVALPRTSGPVELAVTRKGLKPVT